MTGVAVLILHPSTAGRAADIAAWVGASREAVAERHRLGFLAAGAVDVTVVGGPPDGETFGSRLRRFVAERRPSGIVVLGSGAVPLATPRDLRRFVEVAGADRLVALANNRYSADIVAVAQARKLLEIGDLATDNVLPRWLADVCGYEVTDLRGRWRLGFDIDGPLDLVLLGRRRWLPEPPSHVVDLVVDRLARVRGVADDPLAELVVAGRVTAAGLVWFERATASRTRALVEERGFRTARAGQRAVASALGMILDRDGPGALGDVVAHLGDAALVDSRVLLAHRFGVDERRWPPTGDRFASDLLLADRIGDPWLRALTAGAANAPIPILLGGHSLVGPGLRLALGGRPSWS